VRPSGKVDRPWCLPELVITPGSLPWLCGASDRSSSASDRKNLADAPVDGSDRFNYNPLISPWWLARGTTGALRRDRSLIGQSTPARAHGPRRSPQPATNEAQSDGHDL